MAEAQNPETVIPPYLQKLAERFGAPAPDWYVASAESGRGEAVLQVIEEAEQAAPAAPRLETAEQLRTTPA